MIYYDDNIDSEIHLCRVGIMKNQRLLRVMLVAVAWLLPLSGCAHDPLTPEFDSATHNSSTPELSGGPPPQTIGCWPTSLAGPVCGRLVSVSGQNPDGDIVDLTGIVRISSSLYRADYAVMLMDFVPCGFANSHIQIRSRWWTPENIWDTSGCIGATQHTPQWVYDLMGNPYRVMNLDDGKVRFSSVDAFVDYRWV